MKLGFIFLLTTIMSTSTVACECPFWEIEKAILTTDIVIMGKIDEMEKIDELPAGLGDITKHVYFT